MRRMKLADIKISEAFANSIPSREKLNECRNNWNRWHRQDRYIVINPDNVLIDGYIMYLVLKENNVEEVEVKISNIKKRRWHRKNINDWKSSYRKNETTYIYGVHYNKKLNKFSKEYVWRVPEAWSERGWENDLQIGNRILVNTKEGATTIIVTKIVRLKECPVDIPVKKVLCKRNNKRIDIQTILKG